MISVKLFRNNNGHICGFQAKNHGDRIVCSAVSILTLNTVNSIEQFTDAQFSCDFNEEGGFLRYFVEAAKNGDFIHDVDLLLKSLELGLLGIKEEYGKHINISYEEV